MLNGFWSVTFSTNADIGAGVVTILNGDAMGGDSGFTYIGNIGAGENGAVSGELQVSRHSTFLDPVIPGMDHYTLVVSGSASNDQLNLIGAVKGRSDLQMKIVGKKLKSI